MVRQVQGPQDDDDFFEGLRRAADRGPDPVTPAAAVAPDPVDPVRVEDEPSSPFISTRTAESLRGLELRLAEVERQLRHLHEDRERFAADVAEAVVARLDARWARSLGEQADPDAGR